MPKLNLNSLKDKLIDQSFKVEHNISPRVDTECKFFKQIISRKKKQKLNEIDNLDMNSPRLLKIINELNNNKLMKKEEWLP